MPTRLKRPRLAAALAVVALVLAALILLWDWNWFRPMVERRASAAIGREVTIGHFDVEGLRRPWITATGIRIANPPDFTDGTPFAEIDRVAVHLDAKPLLRGRKHLLAIVIDRPRGDVKPSPAGQPNWKFELPRRAPDPDGRLEIGSLEINDGNLRIVDPRFKTDFRVRVRTDKPASGEPRVLADIEGTYGAQPITGHFTGGSVLTLRDKEQPYPVELQLAHGATGVKLEGSLIRPLQFGGADLDLSLKGADLAHLYSLTAIPLPPTPPYTLKGRLDYVQNKVRLLKADGRMGSSDIGGDVVVTLGGERPHVKMDLKSDRILLADLAGLIGATPGVAGAANESTKQKVERAREEAKSTVLPDRPINLPKLRAADFDVHYLGKRIEGKTPLDDFDGTVRIADGKVRVKPLSFGVGEGKISMDIDLDGTGKVVHGDADITFRRVDLKRLMQASRSFDGAGLIGGRAKIKSRGNSLKEMLGNGDGDLKLFMNGGDASALLVDLIGLDFGNVILSALKIPDRATVRCMVSDFELKDGRLETRTLLVDTTSSNIIGKGWISLRDETLDYELQSQPKRIRILALHGPVRITGTMKDPKVRPDMPDLVGRGAAAILLGTLLTPVAALLPILQRGLGDDHDCKDLVEDLRLAAKMPASSAEPAAPGQ